MLNSLAGGIPTVLKTVQAIELVPSGISIKDSEKKVVNFLGRIFSDWSTKYILSASGLGVASGVFCAASPSPVLLAVSISSFAASVFLALYRIYVLIPHKGLEATAKSLQEENANLAVQVTRLQNENKKLDGNIDELKNTRKNLKSTLVNAKEANSQIGLTLKEKCGELAETAEKLGEETKKIEVLKSINEKQEKALMFLAEQVAISTQVVESFQSHSGKIDQFAQTQSSLNEKLAKYEDYLGHAKEQKAQVEAVTDAVKGFIQGVTEEHCKVKEQLQILQQQTTIIHESSANFKGGAEHLEKAASSLADKFLEVQQNFLKIQEGLSDSDSDEER